MGRPKKVRNKIVGAKVRRAISFWGKSISKNNISGNHVCNWSRWSQHGLPKSPTTVYDDIDRGVPVDRICSYARCFNIKVEELLNDSMQPDSSEFVSLISTAKSSVQDSEGFVFDKSGDKDFSSFFMNFNSADYIDKLYSKISGYYTVHYAFLSGKPVILAGACKIDTYKDGCILGKAYYQFAGSEVELHLFFYRWHNNLHVRYYSKDSFELGYFIGIDPTRHHSVYIRSPFYFHMLGITDDGSNANVPINNRLVFEKKGGLKDRVWEDCMEYQRMSSLIEPGDDRYDELFEKIMASDF